MTTCTVKQHERLKNAIRGALNDFGLTVGDEVIDHCSDQIEGEFATEIWSGRRALDHFDMRSEMYTNDADVAAGMADILRRSFGDGESGQRAHADGAMEE